ncbi:hypothetical protein [Labrenzia sp. CE80]|uniref:hypothetical protein n=1 Tax=Labrenzia sp. CE80 TaxID=1788986 RepID=UPI00129B0186|nr:hypothetical protein [Labrenzia sp. CE80]
MPASRRLQIVTYVICALGIAYIWVFAPPFFITVLFVVVCFTWSARLFIASFRNTDELQSASLRYALAAASGYGVPLAVGFVLLMIAVPDIQRAISSLAVLSNLSPAAAGFGLGVSLTTVALCLTFAISQSIWWVSKR